MYRGAACSINVSRREQKKATEGTVLAHVQGAFPSDCCEAAQHGWGIPMLRHLADYFPEN